ncbi:hypothetical protein Bca4012_082673 [Brassica carinata]
MASSRLSPSEFLYKTLFLCFVSIKISNTLSSAYRYEVHRQIHGNQRSDYEEIKRQVEKELRRR